MPYANNLFLDIGSLSDCKVTTKKIENYKKASNARINPLTPTAERISLKDKQCYEKIPKQILFKILSFEVLRDSSPKKGLWEEMINKIKAQLEKFNS
ncbi:hypothetical protein F8M41_020861 [Gigaspora margarita]|uniref:Uncharacterized protein n=1 Tax=Gigaspora margarita TaxID=4874 RepID=A0A8H4ETR3_GIGMA|nr:hypothetical protein F8M41_020861 [Gigaspora margarita]